MTIKEFFSSLFHSINKVFNSFINTPINDLLDGGVIILKLLGWFFLIAIVCYFLGFLLEQLYNAWGKNSKKKKKKNKNKPLDGDDNF